MGEAQKNIGYLQGLLADYLAGHPEKVLSFEHPIEVRGET
jgi:hypothetical protein